MNVELPKDLQNSTREAGKSGWICCKPTCRKRNIGVEEVCGKCKHRKCSGCKVV